MYTQKYQLHYRLWEKPKPDNFLAGTVDMLTHETECVSFFHNGLFTPCPLDYIHVYTCAYISHVARGAQSTLCVQASSAFTLSKLKGRLPRRIHVISHTIGCYTKFFRYMRYERLYYHTYILSDCTCVFKRCMHSLCLSNRSVMCRIALHL